MTEATAAAIAGWREFFVASAGAGAVLLGLVFIGLTIHLEGHEEKPALVPLAVDSATTLFYPVLISLVMLMPPAQPWLPTLVLVVVALFAALSASAPLLQRSLRDLWIGQARLDDWVRYLVPSLASLVLILAALSLVVDPTISAYAIGFVIVIYLVVGTQNAWNLLLAGRFNVGAWSVTRTDPAEVSDDG